MARIEGFRIGVTGSVRYIVGLRVYCSEKRLSSRRVRRVVIIVGAKSTTISKKGLDPESEGQIPLKHHEHLLTREP